MLSGVFPHSSATNRIISAKDHASVQVCTTMQRSILVACARAERTARRREATPALLVPSCRPLSPLLLVLQRIRLLEGCALRCRVDSAATVRGCAAERIARSATSHWHSVVCCRRRLPLTGRCLCGLFVPFVLSQS
jgi:hypothetical protein